MLIKKPVIWLVLVALVAGMISSCQQGSVTTPQIETDQPYPPAPMQQEVLEPVAEATKRPYPVEETSAVVVAPLSPGVVPTPGNDTGVVTGTLVFKDSGEPVQEYMIYLGFKIYLTPGPDYTFGITQNGSPHVATDSEGRFVLSDVPPGTYFVVLWSLSGASLATLPGQSDDLEITVNAGETLDLGALEVNRIGK